MLEIAYKINHTEVMASSVADAVGQRFASPYFEVKNDAFKASIEFYLLNDYLSIQMSKFEQTEPVTVKRLGTENEQLLILDFHVSGVAKLEVTDNRVENTPNGLSHGAYFASSTVESYAVFPPGFNNQQFHIVMDKRWLKEFFSDEIVTSLQRIEKASPFFIYERLNNSITTLLLAVFRSNHQMPFRKTFLHGKTLELLALFFAKLQDRGTHLELGVSNYNDVFRLFDLMLYVDENLGEELAVTVLSKKIGFSESKLQNLCKAVYGKSVSKEITERRMIKALELFEKYQDSISAVGYKLGYTNMSHFSKAFKKVHGFLPSTYLNNRKK